MSHDEMKEIAEAAAHKAVKEVLLALGLDVENPLEMQEDFAFMRSYRQLSQRVGSRVLLTIATLATVGIAGLVWSQMSGKSW